MTISQPVRAARLFATHFGGDPALVARAPGRVNLIGEHTDYNDGFVLPAAIGVETAIAARPRDDGQVHLISADQPGAPVQFALADAGQRPETPQWSDYPRGMMAMMLSAGLPLTGADLAIAGNVPQGAGLSSSAALEVATGRAMQALAAISAETLDATRLAQLAQQAECEFVGCQCGIMDQLVSARGKAGHALLIDCRSLVTQAVAMPADMAILIVHSGVSRGLVDGHYNERRAQCEGAAKLLGVKALRDADLPMLARARGLMDDVTYRRARHVISENARVLAAAEALQRGDLARLGQLMAQSHGSMCDDFEITVPAVDDLAARLAGLIGGEGGARMTGGGFGGAVVALLPQARLADVSAAIADQYRDPQGRPPVIMAESASAGMGLVDATDFMKD